jgi:lysyl-tRNA synthetase class 2
MLDELKQARLEKLERIRNAGINPYPSKSERTLTVAEALRDFDVLSESKDIVTVAGRLRTLREHGALTFADLEDQSGRLQLFFQKDTLGDARYSFLKNVDMGDFIEAKGFLFTTNKGQKTLNAGEFKILTKSLLPLPEKWHGLTDEETRYRKRYLDLIMNEDVRELFRKRTAFIGSIREFLNAKGFMEVETPVLESVPGGAEAEPFITHHNKLDIDFYLRISLELHLKRLMVGGFEKISRLGGYSAMKASLLNICRSLPCLSSTGHMRIMRS